MTDHAEDGRWDRPDAERPNQAVDADDADGRGGAKAARAEEDVAEEMAVESYETDGGTVFYESENPLAWMQSSVTVPLEEHA